MNAFTTTMTQEGMIIRRPVWRRKLQ